MITQVLCPILVGRDDELAKLEDALLEARRGSGSVVVLSGEPGLGKTRLVRELGRRAQRLGCAVLTGACPEAELSLPYLPFLEAVGNHLSSADCTALRTRLGSAAVPLEAVFPQLADNGKADADVSDPAQAKLRLFEAMVLLLRELSAHGGLLLIIEDIHWADRSTQELLDYLTRRLRGSHTLILATFRRSELRRGHPLLPTVQQWRRSGLSETVQLAPLSPEEVGSMVSAIFAVDEVSSEFRALLHERAEGSPFVVEELLKDAVDRGTVFRTKTGGWDRRAIADLALPTSVADNILQRVERLASMHATMLRAASVLGHGFDPPSLAALTGLDEGTVLDALDACVAEQLLEEDPQRHGCYRFRHALTREAVYQEILVSRRERLHARAADVLRARPDHALVDVAHHLLAAGRREEATPVCLAAAEESLRRLAPREACDLFERALPQLVDDIERGGALCRLGEAWHLAGDVVPAQRRLEEGVALLERAGALSQAAHYRLSLGRCCWERSQGDAARRHYERARDDLQAAGPSEDLATAYIRLSSLHTYQLEGSEAQRLAEEALRIAEAAGAETARIGALSWLGAAMCDQGRLDEGLAHLLRSEEEARVAGLPSLGARALGNALSVLESYGRVGECPPLLARMRALPADPWADAMTIYYGAWLHFWGADLAGAAADFERFVATAERTGMATLASWGRGLLPIVHVEQGRLDEARTAMPPEDGGCERQELLERWWVRLRVLLASGEAQAAVAVARRVAAEAWCAAGTLLVDVAVEALLAGGLMDEAARLVDEVAALPRGRLNPGHLARARGRLALATDRPEAALAPLRHAADAFERGGYRLETLRTAVLLADAERSVDEAAARVRVQRVLVEARRCGAAVIAGSAEAVAARLGIDVPGEVLGAVAAARVAAVAGAPAETIPTGERLVTVLFADVRGFTELTRALAPEDLAERIAAFQRFARVAVERRHGVIDKFAGDAVMATFNVTGGRLDHTLQAVECGLNIVDKAELLGLPVGLGVAVGPAVVGTLTRGANLTVLGEVTNLAARLQAQAAGGEALLSEDAHRRVAAELRERGLEAEAVELQLKGFEDPVRAHRLRARDAAARA